MLQIAEPDTLSLLDFDTSLEDACEIFKASTGAQCDSPALFRVVLTCESSHTRTVLMCASDLDIAQHDELSCIRCDKVGAFELAIVLAVAALKK